jgi:trans-aconitate methyltransferase
MCATQTWDPNTYPKNARFVSDLGAPVLELLSPQPGERILDLGCGDGVLTKKIAELLRFAPDMPSVDEAEHFLHNHHTSVAALRRLFTITPECRSVSFRNRCLPSPEYPRLP